MSAWDPNRTKLRRFINLLYTYSELCPKQELSIGSSFLSGRTFPLRFTAWKGLNLWGKWLFCLSGEGWLGPLCGAQDLLQELVVENLLDLCGHNPTTLLCREDWMIYRGHSWLSRAERIEWFIEDQVFLRSYDPAMRPPPSPVVKFSLFLRLLVCRRSSLLKGGGGGVELKNTVPNWAAKLYLKGRYRCLCV